MGAVALMLVLVLVLTLLLVATVVEVEGLTIVGADIVVVMIVLDDTVVVVHVVSNKRSRLGCSMKLFRETPLLLLLFEAEATRGCVLWNDSLLKSEGVREATL